MIRRIYLQNFRNYKKSTFNFSPDTTLIIGPNASGKTNLIEAAYFLSVGKSFRTEKDKDLVSSGQTLARIQGLVGDTQLEVVIGDFKKYLVNRVGKRKTDFLGNFVSVLFHPQDLEIVIDSPGIRRNFLDSVLVQVDRDYRIAAKEYSKGLRQRNALLLRTRETGISSDKHFEYWDNLLIENGEVVTKKREELVDFINNAKKSIFDFYIIYDKSLINDARLEQYKNAERAAGVTLVGPHRDDLIFNTEMGELKAYGSRGQQRLAILELKLIELNFVESKTHQRPTLFLDDIFSELDNEHIKHVLSFLDRQQTIITTTHEEFIPKSLLKGINMVKLD